MKDWHLVTLVSVVLFPACHEKSTGGRVMAPPERPSITSASGSPVQQSFSAAPSRPERPEFVRIEGGEYPLGYPTIDTVGSGAPDDAQRVEPERKVQLKTFWIAVHETTVRSYRECVASGHCSYDSTSTPKTERGTKACNYDVGGRDDHPMNCVLPDEAEKYCAWKSGRLPSSDEWEAAARGREGNMFPWGTIKPFLDRMKAAPKVGGPGFVCMQYGKDFDESVVTCPVMSHEFDQTGAGLFDMFANVAEWTRGDWRDPRNGELMHFTTRGHASYYAASSIVGRGVGDVARRFDQNGFRCARDAAP